MTAEPRDYDWITPEDARRALREGTGKGVRVAVLDTGIDTTHPDLKGLRLTDQLAVSGEGGRLRVTQGEECDVYGHGTAVAGIIHSIAPEAELGSIRVLGYFNESRSSIVREGVRQGVTRGYHILNCSFGCPGRPEFVMSYKTWIDESYIRDVHLVTACNNADFTVPEWPAHFPSVFSVTGTEGDPEEIFYRPGGLVEFGARGEETRALWLGGEYRSVLGSSFAAPRLTALLARLLSVYPNIPPLLAKSLLRRIALPWPD